MFKKVGFLSIFFMLVSVMVFGQHDQIITKAGETIRCTILQNKPTYLSYSYFTAEKKKLKKAVPKTLVASYTVDYYRKNNVKVVKIDSVLFPAPKNVAVIVAKADTNKNTKAVIVAKPEVKKSKKTIAKATILKIPKPEPKIKPFDSLSYSVGIKGGIGYLIANGSNQATPYGDFLKKMKIGGVFGVDALRYFGKHFGIGLNFVNFMTANSQQKLNYYDPVSSEPITNGSLSESRTTKLIAAKLAIRGKINNNSFIVFSASPGILTYTDRGISNKNHFLIRSNAPGAAVNLSYDLLLGKKKVNRDIILSFEAGGLIGNLTQLNYGSPVGIRKLGGQIHLYRTDFAIALRFARFPLRFR